MATTILEQVIAGEAPDLQRLTAHQFHGMQEAGILVEGEPVELLDGLLIRKDRSGSEGTSKDYGKRHASVVRRFQQLTARFEALGLTLQTQLPIAISEWHEPEPDAAVLADTAAAFEDKLPVASDVLLLVEVADSSIKFDRTTKQRVYAAAGIPAYWIVNLRDNTIYETTQSKFIRNRMRRWQRMSEDKILP